MKTVTIQGVIYTLEDGTAEALVFTGSDLLASEGSDQHRAIRRRPARNGEQIRLIETALAAGNALVRGAGSEAR